MNRDLSIKDIKGPWVGDAPTGLLQRCKADWSTSFSNLEDIMIVTYLNQKIALYHMILEAEYRLENEERDDSELFDGQLNEAYKNAKT